MATPITPTLTTLVLAARSVRLAWDRHDEDPAPAPAADPGPEPTPEPPKPTPPTAKPAATVEPPAVDPAPDPDPDVEDPNAKGSKAKVLEDLNAERKRRQAVEKELRDARAAAAEAAAKVEEFENEKRSALEKAELAAEKARAKADAAEKRATLADIRSLAVDFVDPTDAVDVLGADYKRFLDAAGDIDQDAVKTALDDLLSRKPHFKRPPAPEPKAVEPVVVEPPKKTSPQPDPSQGAGRGGSTEIDYMTASKEDVEAALAKLNIRL